ncbi:hypothetical protein SJAV_27060 [Sulfurisphaera javensis]|uniref:Uncharacterized protein n=1 Tax=Sulfurisphaera javensis TaxID=2049879 RepID=A0AAT9GVG8_9CREN
MDIISNTSDWKIIAYILYRLYENEEISIEEVKEKFKGKSLQKIINLIKEAMEPNGTVKIENDKIRRGTVYEKIKERKMAYYLVHEVEAKVSPKYDLSKSYTYISFPISTVRELNGMESVYLAEAGYYSIRCRKIKVFDPFDLGTPNISCEKINNKGSLKISYSLNPSLLPGQIVKWGYYIWYKEFINEREDGVGSFVPYPTYYFKIKVELPWKPSWAEANELTVYSENLLDFDKIKTKHEFIQNENVLVLKIINPEMKTFVIRWKK